MVELIIILSEKTKTDFLRILTWQKLPQDDYKNSREHHGH